MSLHLHLTYTRITQHSNRRQLTHEWEKLAETGRKKQGPKGLIYLSINCNGDGGFPVILYHSISLLAKARKLMLSILNLSGETGGALLALACWKPGTSLLRVHTLLRNSVSRYSLLTGQEVDFSFPPGSNEILLAALQHSY